MEIDSEEKEVAKCAGISPFILDFHPSYYQEELEEPTQPMDLLRDVVDTLYNVERNAYTKGSFKESIQPQRFYSYT